MQERHGPLVSCETLFEHLEDPDWVVFDCRHDLAVPQAGAKAYQKEHVPGSFHAHMDRDLAGPVGGGAKGRHPLPIAFAHFLRTHGVGPETQIVAYDDVGGAWAARLWWLARHHGHKHVAVLDGGLTRWKELDLPLRGGHERVKKDGTFQGAPGQMPTVDAAKISAALANGGITLLDARAPERYRGDVEPLDPVAGHIPGAFNVPYADQVAADKRFLSPDELRARFEALGFSNADGVAAYCGSGVTAAHVVLAFEVAEVGTPALYPGSWSEWCRDAARPVATAPLATDGEE